MAQGSPWHRFARPCVFSADFLRGLLVPASLPPFREPQAWFRCASSLTVLVLEKNYGRAANAGNSAIVRGMTPCSPQSQDATSSGWGGGRWGDDVDLDAIWGDSWDTTAKRKAAVPGSGGWGSGGSGEDESDSVVPRDK
ncbi:hypothetical protein C8R43DRAFT_1117363 [Mycena crocata]|nr:hypothetical protein C8R43DRAFT_1117363 [Mycena crocata]